MPLIQKYLMNPFPYVVGSKRMTERGDSRLFFPSSTPLLTRLVYFSPPPSGLLFYGFCLSGGMFNRLRDAPFMHTQPNGEPEFIYRGSGMQYIVESYIVGALYLAIGLTIIFMNTRVHNMKISYSKRQLLVGVSLLAFVFLWRQLRFVYTLKNGGYNMGWVWSW
jgi:hypothetical protein